MSKYKVSELTDDIINTLIYKEVLNLKDCYHVSGEYDGVSQYCNNCHVETSYQGSRVHKQPDFVNNIKDAFEVVEFLRVQWAKDTDLRRWFHIYDEFGKSWDVVIETEKDNFENGQKYGVILSHLGECQDEFLPRAICICILKSLEIIENIK